MAADYTSNMAPPFFQGMTFYFDPDDPVLKLFSKSANKQSAIDKMKRHIECAHGNFTTELSQATHVVAVHQEQQSYKQGVLHGKHARSWWWLEKCLDKNTCFDVEGQHDLPIEPFTMPGAEGVIAMVTSIKGVRRQVVIAVMEALGMQCAEKGITPVELTHLITGSSHDNSDKVQIVRARNPSCKVVSYWWVLKCIEEKQLVAEENLQGSPPEYSNLSAGGTTFGTRRKFAVSQSVPLRSNGHASGLMADMRATNTAQRNVATIRHGDEVNQGVLATACVAPTASAAQLPPLMPPLMPPLVPPPMLPLMPPLVPPLVSRDARSSPPVLQPRQPRPPQWQQETRITESEVDAAREEVAQLVGQLAVMTQEAAGIAVGGQEEQLNDAIATHNDVIATVDDVVASDDDVIATDDDVIDTVDDVVATDDDVIDTVDDMVATGVDDVIDTVDDMVATGDDDVIATVDDMVATGDDDVTACVIDELVATDEVSLSPAGESAAVPDAPGAGSMHEGTHLTPDDAAQHVEDDAAQTEGPALEGVAASSGAAGANTDSKAPASIQPEPPAAATAAPGSITLQAAPGPSSLPQPPHTTRKRRKTAETCEDYASSPARNLRPRHKHSLKIKAELAAVALATPALEQHPGKTTHKRSTARVVVKHAAGVSGADAGPSTRRGRGRKSGSASNVSGGVVVVEAAQSTGAETASLDGPSLLIGLRGAASGVPPLTLPSRQRGYGAARQAGRSASLGAQGEREGVSERAGTARLQETDGKGGAFRDRLPAFFALSRLHSSDQKKYLAIIRRLGYDGMSGNESHGWDPRVTHVVCPALSRCTKTLAGMACGCWIVDTAYLDSCSTANDLVDPEPFELSCSPSHLIALGAPARWRQHVAQKQAPAFKDIKVLLSNNIPTTGPMKRKTLKQVLEAGGATIVTAHSINKGDIHLAILPPSKTQGSREVQQLMKARVPCVPPLYIVEWLAFPGTNLRHHYQFGSGAFTEQIAKLEEVQLLALGGGDDDAKAGGAAVPETNTGEDNATNEGSVSF